MSTENELVVLKEFLKDNPRATAGEFAKYLKGEIR